MDDMIYRRAAINALRNQMSDWNDDYNVPVRKSIENIERLPSAQPEIIRCKDCKFWLPHSQFGFDEESGEYHDYCEKLVPEDEYYAFYRNAYDFCSRAERSKA